MERREIWLTATPALEPPPGSRFGGDPDLPGGVEWPYHRWPRAEVDTWPDYAKAELESAFAAGHVSEQVLQGVRYVAMPIPFVAQIELAEIGAKDLGLPPTGTLWFFAEQGTVVGEERGLRYVAGTVIHEAAPASARQRRTPPPMPEEWTIPSAALSFATSAREAKQPWPRHAIGSAPDEGALGAIPPPGWVTLLRVDSDDQMNWGDSAWITFAIPQDALAAGRFEAARAFPWIG